MVLVLMLSVVAMLCPAVLTNSINPKDPRFLFKVSVSPDPCIGDSGLSGICYKSSDCTNVGGTGSGSCAKGLGVCCTFTRTCLESTSVNNTLFQNPNYPAAESTSPGSCDLTVFPANNNICQIRLDFLVFELTQPNSDGDCVDDYMTVTGGTSTVPKLCGDNDGQHMYIEVDPSFGSVKINMDVSGISGTRSWQINVAQIACNSEYKAPAGCLQYFLDTFGTVRSFNYVTATVTPGATEVRQLANHQYGVCIRRHTNRCSITWTRPSTENNLHFGVSLDGTTVSPDGSPQGVTAFGLACTADYVLIPGGDATLTGDIFNNFEGQMVSTDRYCGTGFPTSVISFLQPFGLYVFTNEDEGTYTSLGQEITDVGNRGFSLYYRLNAC